MYYDDGALFEDYAPAPNTGPIIGSGGILDEYSATNIFDAEGNFNPSVSNDFYEYNGNLLDGSTGDVYTVGGEYIGNINSTPAAASTSGGSFFSNLLKNLTGTNSTTKGGSPAGASGGSMGSGFTSGKTTGSSGPGSGSTSANGANSSRLNTYPINAPSGLSGSSAQTFSVIVPLALVAIVAIFALKKSD